MSALCVDATCFVLPVDNTDEAQIGTFLDRLVHLEELILRTGLVVVTSSEAYVALASAGMYPVVDLVPPPLFPQRHDVLRLIHLILERSRRLEDHLGIEEVLVDDFSCRCTPEIMKGSLPALAAHFHRLLALMGVASIRTGGGLVLPMVILVERAPGEPQEVVASGLVEDWEPKGTKDSSMELPVEYTIEIVVCESVPVAIKQLNPVSLLMRLERYDWAIALALHHASVKNGGATWPLFVARFAVRDEFVQSLISHGFDRDPSKASALLRACVEIVTGNAPTKGHRLRVGASGSAPDRVREYDGALALRHDITYEYHVHYWSTPGGPELTVVRPHNDFSIPD